MTKKKAAIKKTESRIVTIVKSIESAEVIGTPAIGLMKVSKVGSSARDLEQKLFDFFNDRLKDNAFYKQALKDKDARLIYMLANQVAVGIREEGGNNKGPMVELMQKTIGSASREAWCMSGQQSCLEFAEEVTGVVSPIFPSEHCQTVFNKTPKTFHVKRFPSAAAMIIWQNWKGGKALSTGHTGCLESADGKTMITYEANTEAGLLKDGSMDRDGGGFYRVRRNFTANGSMKVRGFLIPFPAVKQ